MPDKYIVVFKKGTSQEDIDKYANEVGNAGGEIHHRYSSTTQGFAATIPDGHLQTLKSLQDDGPIDYIEPDGVVTTQ